jgi:integrative and conjugative element protein (TIGR02256 family)
MNIDYFQDKLQLKVSLPMNLIKEIQEKFQEETPFEFGGILLGTYDEEFKTAMVTKTLFPKEFDSSPVEFTRSAEDLNIQIAEIFKQSNGKEIYLGEWHSHPNMLPKYSITDFRTMNEIANDDGISISNPILIIMGGEPTNVMVSVYAYFNDELFLFNPITKE